MAARVTEWIGMEQLADELDVPIRTLYNWRSLGKGPRGYRIANGRVRFRREDVNAWLETFADDGRPAA